MPARTKAQLEAELARLQESVADIRGRVADEQALRVTAELLAADRATELNTAREEALAAAQQAAAAIAAATNQAPAPPQPPADDVLIPKPRGSGGTRRGYNVQRAMGLANDQAKYAHCIRVIHEVTMASKINWQKDYTHQDPLVLGRLFRVAQEQEPYLARFEASWATADLLKQYLGNRRKYGVQKGYIPRRAQRVQQGLAAGNGLGDGNAPGVA